MSAPDNATPHLAADYDVSVRQTIAFYEAIQAQTVDVARTIKTNVDCWWDAGCGTGYLVELAIPHFPRTSFVLTDPSQAMLDQAESRLKKYKSNNVKFLPPIGNQNLITYEGKAHPQIVTAILCNHYLRRDGRRAATQACYRLLEQDGVFITVENISPVTEGALTLDLRRWRRFQLERGRPPSVVDDHITRFNTEYFPITVDEHLDLLRRTGFRNASLFWLSYMQAGFYAVK
jgi:tRNA (cmo5U34)-methyltransferase